MAGQGIQPRKTRSDRSQRTRALRMAMVSQPTTSGEVRTLRSGSQTLASHHLSHARKPGELGRGRLQW
jgi:hypothetical protein